MTHFGNAEVGCLFVGEFIDEAECPANISVGKGEPERPHAIFNYLDIASSDEKFREFTVLLKDGRSVAVRGDGLKLLSNAETGDGLHYGIVIRADNEDIIVALVKSSEVVGIFQGEMQTERKIA